MNNLHIAPARAPVLLASGAIPRFRARSPTPSTPLSKCHGGCEAPAPTPRCSCSEEAQLVLVVRGEDVLGLAVMRQHHLVRLAPEAALLVPAKGRVGRVGVVAVEPDAAECVTERAERGRRKSRGPWCEGHDERNAEPTGGPLFWGRHMPARAEARRWVCMRMGMRAGIGAHAALARIRPWRAYGLGAHPALARIRPWRACGLGAHTALARIRHWRACGSAHRPAWMARGTW